MPYRILIITKGYARYRENLVSGIAASLPDDYQIIHTTPSKGKDLWEVDWPFLLGDGGLVMHVNLPRMDIRTFITALACRLGWRSGRVARSLQRLEDISPDIIIIQEYSLPMLKAALYAKLRGIPCLGCSDLGKTSDWSLSTGGAKFVHRFFPSWFITGLIAHTQAAMVSLDERKRPTCFIPHSVDIRGFASLPRIPVSEKIGILMVAQYLPLKGHDLLAKALRALVDRGISNFKVNLVGTQDPSWVREVIARESLHEFVNVLGVLKGEALFKQFQTSDVFVQPSRFDTFGVAVHEAAAFGLPLIVSQHAGSATLLVKEGINGYIVDPEETMILANRLENLIADPELRNRMGRESRNIAKTLCASKLGAKLAEWVVRHHRDLTRVPTRS